eukprot:7871582-Alexandrium_andersonii.AAC.1
MGIVGGRRLGAGAASRVQYSREQELGGRGSGASPAGQPESGRGLAGKRRGAGGAAPRWGAGADS